MNVNLCVAFDFPRFRFVRARYSSLSRSARGPKVEYTAHINYVALRAIGSRGAVKINKIRQANKEYFVVFFRHSLAAAVHFPCRRTRGGGSFRPESRARNAFRWKIPRPTQFVNRTNGRRLCAALINTNDLTG